LFTEGIESVLVTFTIIGRDFEDFNKHPPSPDPSNVKQQVDGIRDVASDSSMRQFYAALQDAVCKASDGLSCGICVQCAETS